MACVYCGRSGPFNDEHILARAFAGSGENWTLKDLVCVRCNKLFSTYERAWTSEPGAAMARIYWGPAGRERKGQAYQVHPSENIFLLSDDDAVAYEVDILRGLQPRVRAQVVSTPSSIFSTAGDADGAKRLADATNAFLKERAITIQKRDNFGPNQFRVAIIALDGTPRFERLEWRSKPAPVWVDWFQEGVKVSSDPRMSVDAFGRLRFRVSKLRNVTELLNRMFSEEITSPAAGEFEPGKYTIAVRSIYDVGKVHRAVAKTLLNYAIDEFGPTWIASPGFRPALDYCRGLIGDPPNHPFVGVMDNLTGISAFDSAPPERHALALCSNSKLVIGLVKLYGGSVYRVHLGPHPPDGMRGFVRAVQIDYNGVGRVGSI